jgi:hypothetical protein
MADMETERDGFRAFMVDTVATFDLCQRLDLKKRRTGDLTEAETHTYKRALKVVRHRTPLTKYYGTEAGTRIALKCVQALGGYGYMKEYDAERIFRDAVGGLLYEGTSQVQSLMAMKDLMKMMMKNPARFVRDLLTGHPLRGMLTDSDSKRAMRSVRYDFRKNVAALMWRCFRPGVSPSEGGFNEVVAGFGRLMRPGQWIQTENVERLMTHAEGICESQAYLEVLMVLQRQADKDPGRQGLFWRYHRLVAPRLAAVYEGWRL